MKRREIAQFLREIDSFPDIAPFTYIYLKPHHSISRTGKEDLELHIKIDKDTSTQKAIEDLARARGFLVKDEHNGFLVVHSSKRKLTEINA